MLFFGVLPSTTARRTATPLSLQPRACGWRISITYVVCLSTTSTRLTVQRDQPTGFMAFPKAVFNAYGCDAPERTQPHLPHAQFLVSDWSGIFTLHFLIPERFHNS